MKVLLVGDPHVTVDELADAQSLMDYVFELAVAGTPLTAIKPDKIVILGDLHHNHAVVRVEVTDFWLQNLERLGSVCPVTVLLGNHDRPNDATSRAHALQPYKRLNGVTVIDSFVQEGDIGYAPYYASPETLYEVVLNKNLKWLFCHQTFDGSVYENGFYAPDGADPVLVGVPRVVSGHIHTSQNVNWPGGYVYYPGSPRWRTQSDANVSKSVILLDTSEDTVCNFSTAGICSAISKTTITAVEDFDRVEFQKHRNTRHYLEIVGNKARVEELVKEAGMRFDRPKIRTLLTDVSNKANKVTESEGLSNALKRFVANYKPQFGTSPTDLQKMVATRLVL